MNFSDFGKRFNRYSGISHLMDDLSAGLLDDDMVMLGGGNPASIPQVLDVFQHTLDDLQERGDLVKALVNYDASQGNQVFLESLADYFNKQYGWGISRRNIALTHGSQSAFFALFNSFAGSTGDARKHVLLPITPEYIGYTDLGIEDHLFVSQKPQIETLSDQFFKYHIDFDHLEVTSETGVICVSRPTNPSGNVLTDEECQHLDQLARKNNVPLLVDNAYGTPFPHIIFNEVNPFWNDNTIVCLSLSKLGLPGVRTGIVIANEEVIRQLSNMTAITSLAPGGVGPAVVNELLQKQLLTTLCDDVIRPFYQNRCEKVVEWLKQSINDERLHIHLPEGAIFLWLWFEGLSITTSELYEELKKEGLLVVPGKYFFPGQDDPGEHAESCIRMNYVQSEADLQKGINILSSTLKRYW
ncbi:MAG: valine--pyruvate transaminase [Gammaproteobacteria bacterium]|jgi:valine--pyruvate aminotransferase|nr:valine--pyruvate transaminase [Gammaproteobacteria bacterium]MBT3724238.1 valine--pyruvate transaminase [Gammaproteobacteria bacterium]MBT4078960.1 valine--pyruvate transaminase [Gammaproteobacteria bacterium]MBT4194493.1 valine--pyruvate transaminase [Gammaproteobacteria bacterium]MBT4450721.1 valine--pyruvate transaminase [Gammaproteobacteria bacterium]